MKYAIILIDGASDYRIEELGNKTPLEAANKPYMDFLAENGELGMVKTIPDKMPPGSDIANLSVLGYNPKKYYTGRSSLEAVSMGIRLSEDDVTFRCNLVTLSEEDCYGEKTMIDYSAGEITTEEAKHLIKSIGNELGTKQIKFYPGVSYRHVIVWKNGPFDINLTAPHDILDKKIGDFLPKGNLGEKILDLMIKSTKILKKNKVNIRRINKKLRPANSIWIWGQGRRPILDSFTEKYNLRGSVISAVDLIKGIGICVGLEPVYVAGATGNINTNFEGKAKALIGEFEKGRDFVYLHIEAPDECSHQGRVYQKVSSIEIIDRRVIKTIIRKLNKMGEDYKIMVLPDHNTPIKLKTHTSEPVPFLIYDSRRKKVSSGVKYDEFNAGNSKLYFDEGYKLTNYFLDKS